MNLIFSSWIKYITSLTHLLCVGDSAFFQWKRIKGLDNSLVKTLYIPSVSTVSSGLVPKTAKRGSGSIETLYTVYIYH